MTPTSPRRLVAALAALALLLAACGDDDDTATDDTTTTTTSDASGAGDDDEPDEKDDDGDDHDDHDDGGDLSDLEAMLLTEADMPDDYVLVSSGPVEDDDDGTTPEFCEDAFEAFEEDLDSEQVEAEFERGESTDAGGAMLMQGLARNDADVMAERFDELPAAFEQCTDISMDDDGVSMVGTLSPVDFPSLGEDSYAARMTADMTVSGTTIPVVADMVFVREGGVVMTMMSFGFGNLQVPTDELIGIVETAHSKL